MELRPRMEKGLRVRGHGNAALRVVEERDEHGACAVDVPGSIGDGARRYEIVREISRGGMGTVHLGRLRGPLGFAKNVAIKTMHARDVADPQIARMFAAEARLTAGLCHANIVSTVDVMVEDGSVFIVMEYIEGRSLAELVAAASELGVVLPVDVSCAIVHDVLLGLDHAHDAGVIHCDISPQNVLVGVDGLARILDFGIAKVATSARESNGDADDTVIRGKVPYMAPEQLRGRKMDHRVDLYSVGTTLWELLTGRGLFRGASRMEIMANVLRANVEPPSRWLTQVPPALDAFVLAATQRDPRARFASARDMANALAASVPLASRETVVATMRRLDGNTTPGSGIRALSPAELAIRKEAREARLAREAPPVHPLAPTTPFVVQAPPGVPPVDRHRTTMSHVRKQKARRSFRVRLATVGFLGIAFGIAQVTFNVIPVDRLFAPAKPRAAVTAAPIVVPAPIAPPPVATPAAVPTMQDPTPPPSAKPRGTKVDKPRR